MTDAAKIELTEEELQAKIEEAISGLKAKNTELIGEVRALKKGRTVDPAEIDKLEEQLEATKAKLTATERDLTKAQKAAETATKTLEAEKGFTQKLLVDNGLVSELAKHGVTDPAYLKAAQAVLRSGVQVVEDGETRTAKVGDKALSDYVKEWAASDEGKRFVTAPNNGGGGATGGAGKAGGKTMSRADYDAKSQAGDPSVNSFFKEGGVLTD